MNIVAPFNRQDLAKQQLHLRRLLDTGTAQLKLKGQLVHTFGDAERLYYIHSGYVKRYLISNEGSLGIQSIYGPGYFFPLSPLYTMLFAQSSVEETYYYEAMTAVQVSSLSVEAVIEAVGTQPILYSDLLFESWRRLQSNISQLENVSLKSASKKVAHGLVYLANEFGIAKNETQGTSIQIPIVYQDLASALGLTRETVARVMSYLKSHELISTDHDRHINVSSIDNLAALYR